MGGRKVTLEVSKLCFSYHKKGTAILDDVSLAVDNGEIYSLLGGSGSGKTTLLNIVAGFLSPENGSVIIDDRDVTDLKVEKRNIGMVFQDYALFPHMNVRSNVAFGLSTRGISSGKMKKGVAKALKLVDLVGMDKKMPYQLSGGEKQRVALARALVYDPSVLLLDEPLSALDASLRENLRRELSSILKELDIPALYVTHDQMEALSISDKIGFLNGGRILEEGSPDVMYWKPRWETTARFMGMYNILPVEGRSGTTIKTPIGELPWTGGAPKLIGFRPESLEPAGSGFQIECIVRKVEYRGKEQFLDMNCSKTHLRALVDTTRPFHKGDRIVMGLNIDNIVPLQRNVKGT